MLAHVRPRHAAPKAPDPSFSFSCVVLPRQDVIYHGHQAGCCFGRASSAETPALHRSFPRSSAHRRSPPRCPPLHRHDRHHYHRRDRPLALFFCLAPLLLLLLLPPPLRLLAARARTRSWAEVEVSPAAAAAETFGPPGSWQPRSNQRKHRFARLGFFHLRLGLLVLPALHLLGLWGLRLEVLARCLRLCHRLRRRQSQVPPGTRTAAHHPRRSVGTREPAPRIWVVPLPAGRTDTLQGACETNCLSVTAEASKHETMHKLHPLGLNRNFESSGCSNKVPFALPHESVCDRTAPWPRDSQKTNKTTQHAAAPPLQRQTYLSPSCSSCPCPTTTSFAVPCRS